MPPLKSHILILLILFLSAFCGCGESGSTHQQAIVELEKAGGQFTYDEQSPNKPVIKIEFSGRQLADEALVHLRHFPELKELSFGYRNISDAGLVHLQGLNNLQILALGSDLVTDAGLVHLKTLPRLSELDLFASGVTDAGMVHLKELTGI